MAPGFHIEFRGTRDDIARVTAALTEYLSVQGLGEDVRRGLLVVLDELLANLLSHALAGRPEGRASLDVARSAAALVVTLEDDGPEFDPFAVAAPDTTLSVEARPIGGLGIHLVRRMVDDATYHRRGDRNVTVLTKRLPDNASRSQPGGR